MVKIFIDPGHGGSDPGATGNGLQEKRLTLQIATSLRDILLNEYEGVSVLLSRTSNQTVSLNQRTNAAKAWEADFFLSIHINTGGGTGFESYVYPGVGSPTTTYQNFIHEEIMKKVDFTNRGIKSSNFHVLRESNVPALLTENGFIDNANDANKLRSISFINNLARGHANGLANAFNLTQKTTTTPLYKVQIGEFSEKANADTLAAQAKSKDFESIVLLQEDLYKVQIGAFSLRTNAVALANRAKNAGFAVFVTQE